MRTRSYEESDRIFIKDLSLTCIIGVNEEERKNPQDVLINVEVWADLKEAMKTDDIEETVDYKILNKKIIGMVENSKFFLIETLAERIAGLCRQTERIQKVKVTVEKPGALRFAKSVGIEVNRTREQNSP